MIIKNKIVFVVPAIALIIALIQWGLFESTHLSRWKGGGFGMYTELHPNVARTSWVSFEVNSKAFRLRGKDLKDSLKTTNILGGQTELAVNHLYNKLKDLRYFPNEKNMKSASELFKIVYKASGANIENICIEVTELELDMKTKMYTNKSLVKYCENRS
ncbi:putative exported protein [Halobacteriovorax marinus SJ]|uniref:Exported protein n=1 Tax=Halobacteriovorax marinus (strain ATCC BAA-682 / DSM 15412 / SJ) TaxID=862908 RepID=E1X100_HALMS|nr:hypothetical protein [Halobacteriovorax marinus]CBW28070.1 putative exported protein [Halobacteriovorax marinus SJ]